MTPSQWLDWDCPSDPEVCERCGRPRCRCDGGWRKEASPLRSRLQMMTMCGITPEQMFASLTPLQMKEVPF